MDWRAWIDHVKAFTEELRKLPGEIHCKIEVDPPLPQAAIADLALKWPTGLPASLKELWTRGSGRVRCPYVWTPPLTELPRLRKIFERQDSLYGGVTFEATHEIFPGNSGADPNDDAMRETLGDRDLALWCRCALFLHMRNGDFLGLDPERNPADPAVVYLCHDEPESA